jgi:hypothetical protein
LVRILADDAFTCCNACATCTKTKRYVALTCPSLSHVHSTELAHAHTTPRARSVFLVNTLHGVEIRHKLAFLTSLRKPVHRYYDLLLALPSLLLPESRRVQHHQAGIVITIQNGRSSVYMSGNKCCFFSHLRTTRKAPGRLQEDPWRLFSHHCSS